MKCTTDFVFGNSKMGTYILWSEPVYRSVVRNVCVCEPMCESVPADMRENIQEYKTIERISEILTSLLYNFGENQILTIKIVTYGKDRNRNFEWKHIYVRTYQ